MTTSTGGVPRVLVLGYGNPGREDDGLGPAAVAAIERLAWPHVTVGSNYQLVIEDVVEIAAADIVWFVDASRDGAEPWATRSIAPTYDVTFTSHLVSPGALLAMAQQYYGKAPAAHLLAIRGYEFAFAEGLTDRATANLRAAVALLRRAVGAGVPPAS
jgi:hydrogenase maturation protease